MKKHILTSFLYTAITTLLLGIVYPLAVTAIARGFFRAKADGQLIYDSKGQLTGSRLIGQAFTGEKYFHSRPSSAGTGYDAQASSGSNLAPTNKTLVDRVQQSVTTEGGGAQTPIDLVTTSGSGLDPDITPAAAYFQMSRVANARGISEPEIRALIDRQITPREFGFLGEARVNVLELNLKLDQIAAK